MCLSVLNQLNQYCLKAVVCDEVREHADMRICQQRQRIYKELELVNEKFMHVDRTSHI